MKALFDLHTHTIGSGHAFSTIKENIEEAQKIGLKVLGSSDHAPAMPGAFHEFYLGNCKVIPKQMGDLRVLWGTEVNVLDYDGKIDMEEKLLRKMDYVIASLHPHICIQPGTIEENTRAVINVMDNPYVKIIGHPDDDRIPVDLEKVVQAAVEKKVVLEVNNSSLNPLASRQGGKKNIMELLRLAKEYHAYIIMGTDSHICYQIGKFEDAEAALNEADFPDELVLNYDLDKLKLVLNKEF